MKNIFNLVKKTFEEWSEDKASRLAAALAYYTVFSIPPLIVIAIGIASYFFDRQAVEELLTSQFNSLMGSRGAEAIATILESADEPGRGELIPTIISVVLLLFGASGVFVQLQDALNTIWDVKPHPKRGIMAMIKDRFLSFTMVLAVGFVLLVSLMLSTLLASFGNFVGGLVSETETLLLIINFIISFVAITALFAVIFKAVPDVEISWRDVWIGAALTGLLFKIGEYALSFYFDRSDPTSAFGAAGSIILLLLWVYYSAQILFFGAEFTQVYTNQYGAGMKPAEGAIALTETDKINQGIPSAETLEKEQKGGVQNP